MGFPYKCRSGMFMDGGCGVDRSVFLIVAVGSLTPWGSTYEVLLADGLRGWASGGGAALIPFALRTESPAAVGRHPTSPEISITPPCKTCSSAGTLRRVKSFTAKHAKEASCEVELPDRTAGPAWPMSACKPRLS